MDWLVRGLLGLSRRKLWGGDAIYCCGPCRMRYDVLWWSGIGGLGLVMDGGGREILSNVIERGCSLASSYSL